MVGRMEACGEALGQPVAGMRPLEMADGVVRKAREVGARIRELAGVRARKRRVSSGYCRMPYRMRRRIESVGKRRSGRRKRLGRCEESRRTALDLERAGTARQQAESQIAALTEHWRVVSGGWRRMNRRRFAAITKRALQVRFGRSISDV